MEKKKLSPLQVDVKQVKPLVFGQEYYGAKNWLMIGPLSLQPSELTKVCFVFIGAAPMELLMKKKNLISG